MYYLTITEDLYGYVSGQYEANGIVCSYDTLEEALKMAQHFIKRGFSVAIEKEVQKAGD